MEDGKVNFVTYFRFQKAHMYTVNPQTQSRPMVFLQLTAEGRYRLLDYFISGFPLGIPN